MKKMYLMIVGMLTIAIQSFGQIGTLDLDYNSAADIWGNISAFLTQTDGKTVIVGDFVRVNSTTRQKIARLTSTGYLDFSFNPGAGANNRILAAELQTDGKIVIAGEFTTYYGVSRKYIARVNQDGSLDTGFNPGTGANALVSTIAIQPDGKILIGGEFTAYNGTTVNRIARLNTDGSLDNTFTTGTAANSNVLCIKIQTDNKILISGHFTTFNGTTRNYIARLNVDGTLDTSFDPGAGANTWILTMTLQPDGKILLGGAFTTYQGNAKNYICRINADGSIDNTFVSAGGNYWVTAIQLFTNGDIVVGGRFTQYNGASKNYLAILKPDGTNVDVMGLTSGPNYIVSAVNIVNDDKILIGGGFSSVNYRYRRGIARLNSHKGVFGRVFLDKNNNCSWDSGEPFYYSTRLLITPGNILVNVQSNGYWHVNGLAPGNYTAKYVGYTTYNNVTAACGNINFTVVSTNSTTIAPSLPLSVKQCTAPEVYTSIFSARPCFNTQYIYISVYNKSYATQPINNGYVLLELDPLMTLNDVLYGNSYTALGGNKYKIMLNKTTLNPGNYETMYAEYTMSCSAVMGQTYCVKASLYPLDSCSLDEVPDTLTGVSPCTLPWDKSSLKVTGTCEGDSMRFVVLNHGSGDMDCYTPVRIYIDGQFTILDSIKLTSGDSAVYVFAADGKTWRLEADQHPLHPGNSHPNVTIENCNPGTWTQNLVNILPHDDADGYVDIDCLEATLAYDPNDKTGYPTGVNTTHDIMPNQEIEYLIRFQNTGTDTAFTVIVRDTLDADLDLYSVDEGVSDHEFDFRMYENRVLEWTFSRILLPDSNTNEKESHGFIKFRVQQNKNLPNNTQITNSAGIYFDYNSPIITNTTLHTVNDGIKLALSTQKPINSPSNKVQIYPNPATDKIYFYANEKGKVEVYSLLGTMLKQSEINIGISEMDVQQLPKGIYVFKVNNENTKVIIE